ncbi:tetratricopeptide repeat protein [Pedobacter sp. KR3-3]|uniref:histidine kinase n=1 Tax=Pedobacter albus TaxID=3113905 RepID=A0ABU7IA36_9SPHI|nr:tetratricopeptide repeat protein [Pedobacter sp. KR3-3]MEE1946347.1 tetratricopeptide repeat protein [Pedobacter sp. KR3-3]
MKRLLFLLFSVLFVLSCSKNTSQKQEPQKIDNVFYDKAFKFRDTLKVYDSAYYYFNKAKDVFLKQNDSLRAGKCLVHMAIISTDKGDYFGGQELSLSAIPYFHTGKAEDSVPIASNFNNLGLAYSNLKNYEKAIEYYQGALSFTKDHNSLWALKLKNNIANSYRDKEDYKTSLMLYRKLLAQKIDNTDEYARIITNNAIAEWLQNPNYNAAPELLNALHIREKEKDPLALNSSYSHLADYYTKKKPDSALLYAQKMYLTAKKINSPDDQSQALEKLIKLSPSEAIKYFAIYQPLKDSIEIARNKAKNQFAVIRYDTEKHKSDSLKFQKDSTEKTYMVITLIVLLGLGFFWYRKRKQRLEMEKENAIKESRLKTSKKVHDVVANGLYRVMNKIEYQPELDKEILLDEIEDLYEKSRDISYEKPLAPTSHFHQKLASLANSFNTDKIQIHLIDNTPTLWEQVNATAKDEVTHILQELLVNMRKHSEASEVTLQFARQENELHITYQDNGIGIKGAVKSNNGLRNTETRIKNLNGQITFETGSEKGLSINFSFPV